MILIAISEAKARKNIGKLSGHMIDNKTKEPLIGATLKLSGMDLGAITDLNGFFSIDKIPPQTYSVEVSYVGFVMDVIYNVIVRSGGIPDLMFRLKEDVNQLGDVVVTTSPFRKSEETPLSIQRLSTEEIATFPGGNNDIAKVVQVIPGVGGSVGGFRNDIIIRSTILT